MIQALLTSIFVWLIGVGPVLAADPALAGNPTTVAFAGTVKTLSGQATLQGHALGPSVELHVGDRVQEGDCVRTQASASLGITMADDTLVSMGPASQFLIERFRFDPQTNQGSMVVRVLRGTMAFVTGLIAKSNPGNMEVHTPAATVGIRGTEFIVDVPPEAKVTE